MINFLTYLGEVTVCQSIFCILYLMAFRNLSFFQFNRVFLVSSTLIGFIIPILTIPFWNAASTDAAFNLKLGFQNLGTALGSSDIENVENSFFKMELLLILISFAYFSGFSIRLFRFCKGIIQVLKLVKDNEIRKFNSINTVYIERGPSFFAFLSYVFINTNKLQLSPDEFQQVMNHEKSHVVQKHTLDNLFMELAITICWFNPFLRIMKKELNNVHEFYADQVALANKGDVDSYSTLILKLSTDSDEKSFLSHQFSMIHIKKRIVMLNKKKNPKKFVLRYLMIVPCLALLLVMFSFTRKSTMVTNEVNQNDSTLIIGNISWKGNTIYSDGYLSDYLGLKNGDIFNENEINDRLNYRPDGSDLTSLFMDKGHLFFTIEIKKVIDEQKVNLTFEVYEGEVMSFGKVFVTGNKDIQTQEILKMIELKEGELFTRSKLISSQQKIIESGLFNPEKTVVYPHPQHGKGIVDIEFKVTEQ
ncbi:MAG: POTRA domain-containing protein [Cyclobacteriaceae bacterium]